MRQAAGSSKDSPTSYTNLSRFATNRRTNVSQPAGAELESKLPDGSAHLYYITFSVGYTGCFQIFYGDPVSGGATGSLYLRFGREPISTVSHQMNRPCPFLRRGKGQGRGLRSGTVGNRWEPCYRFRIRPMT